MSEAEAAIIGAGCRFPGADNLDEFWRVLVNGENHVIDIPETRWNNDAFYDSDERAPGKIYVKKAGLLTNHDTWDNRLFGISDAEASLMDPQQRYVLECVHMALEDAGITRKQINGTKTGVIIGCMNDDYKALANSDADEIGTYNATGTATSVISARVSYVYNLQGTCLVLDTACSSSIVAIHLASKLIMTGDCDMVVCGGVSSILCPDTFTALCKARMMSKIGQCQSFCDTADGYARGEGCGIVILKGLKAAQRDGNKIWATIKTGSNQDGSMERPMTAPSGKMQLELLKRVYEEHGFKPSEIQYIEAHGTGTPRGDPTELNALGKFFASFKRDSVSLPVGSVKSNIGHTESAAGVAGLLKVLLMMAHGQYVPSLHVKPDGSNINKGIHLAEYNVEVVTSVKPWPTNENGERYACLNSFGFGGSNTHAIITQVDGLDYCKNDGQTKDKLVPICISGVDQDSLKLNLNQFALDIDSKDSSLSDMALTSLTRRDIFPYRTLTFGTCKADIQNVCQRRIESVQEIGPVRDRRNVVFVYCGVGTTWTGMCQEFMQNNEIFRNTVNKIDNFLAPLSGWKIGDKFLAETCYDDPFVSHIAIFSAQVALTEVWKSFGVIPDSIIGQSVGEVAASYAASIISLQQAVKVIYHRSEILARQSVGTMTVVGNIDLDQVENVCKTYEDSPCIAVYSSPKACTLSGHEKDLIDITNALQDGTKAKLLVKRLNVRCAYHSPLLRGCMSEVKEVIDTVFMDQTPFETVNTIRLISTITGTLASPDDMRTGEYWANNVLLPVKFMQSIEEVFKEDSFNVYVEVGPHPVLRAHLKNILNEDIKHAITVPSMKSGKEQECLYDSLAELFQLGVDIKILMADTTTQSQVTTIPRYKFNNTGPLFLSKGAKAELAGVKKSQNSHMFVQSFLQQNEQTFQITIDSKSTPFVYDHFLSDRIVLPGATYLEVGFHIGLEVKKKPVDQLQVSFEFVKIFSPMVKRQELLNVEMIVKTPESFQFSVTHDGNILGNGSVCDRNIPNRYQIDIEYLKAMCTFHKSKRECYDALRQFAFQYGDRLTLIRQSWVSETGTKCLTEIKLPAEVCAELSETHFHPSVIDSMFQIFGIMADGTTGFSMNRIKAVPKGLDALVLNKPVETEMYVFGEMVDKTDRTTHFNAVLLSKNGAIIAEMVNFYTKTLTDETQEDNTNAYALNWFDVSDFNTNNSSIPEKIIFFSAGSQPKWLEDFVEASQSQVLVNITLDELEDSLASSETSTLIYHVGTCDENESSDSNGIYNGAAKRILDAKKLVMLGKTYQKAIRIFFITENTQSCPDRQYSNYNGSELWGMLRSAVHEGYNGNIFIADVDVNNLDIPTLLKFISCQYDGNSEFLLSGSACYMPKLCTYQKQCNLRKINVPSADKLAICTKAENEVNEPYFLLDQDKHSLRDALEISLHSFVAHDKALYNATIKSTGLNDHILRKGSDRNYQILALEGKGKITQTGNEIVFLYPVRAAATVYIPKEFIIEVAGPHVVANGAVMLTNIAYQVVSSIKRYSKITIIKGNTMVFDPVEEIFKQMLNKRGCKFQFTTLEELQYNQTPFPHDTVVVTCISTLENWKYISASFPNMKEVITLNMFLSEHLQMELAYAFQEVKFTIHRVSDMFRASRIRTALATIKTYFLQHFRLAVPTTIESSFLSSLPMDSVDVKAGIENGSLNMYCNKENLFQRQAAYIVIGGLTGLGWVLLECMAKNGAGVVATMSRRKPSNEIIEQLRELQENYSCQMISLQADVTSYSSVKNAFSELRHSFPNHPVKGIFHGAGVLSDAILENLTEEQIARVLMPKLQGAWNLHAASLEMPIDYFVMHSSIVSVLGNFGQCNYAAANSFLDSFALYRRSRGLPAQSLNWGALSVGMATRNEEIESQLKRTGFNVMSKESIMAVFLDALITDSTNTLLVDVHWKNLLSIPTFSMQTYKYSNIQRGKAHVAQVSKKRYIDLVKLRSLGPVEKALEVGTLLKDIISEILTTDGSDLTDETSLTDVGIDSMAAMNLTNAIADTFSCQIEMVSLLSEGTTISSLTTEIINILDKSDLTTIDRPEENNDTLKYQDVFEANDFTFMQRDFLDILVKDRNNPFLLLVVDLRIKRVKFRFDEWQGILSHVVTQHEELRKKYIFTEDGSVIIERPTDVSSLLDIKWDSKILSKKEEVGDIRRSMSADIHNTLPISFRLAEKRSDTILRIIVHKVAMDIRGMSLLFADIGGTCIAYGYKNSQPPVRTHVDINNCMKESILPRMNQLSNFWGKYLDHDIRPITLGSSLQESDFRYCSQSHVDFPPDIVMQIHKFISKLSISLYEFLVSVYQLYLFIRTQEPIIIVGTAADMRFHAPMLNKVITRCTNYIPLVAHFHKENTLMKFVQVNSAQISATTMNGAFPSSLILQKIKSADARSNAFNHCLVMHDLSIMSQLTKTDGGRARLENVWHSTSNRETFVYVDYDLRSGMIKLETGANLKVCGRIGETIMEDIQYLVYQVINFENKTVTDVKETLDSVSSGRLMTTAEDKAQDSNRQLAIPSTVKNTDKGFGTNMVYPGNTYNKEKYVLYDSTKTIKQMKKKFKPKLNTDGILLTSGVQPKHHAIINGEFKKETKHGWDHNVRVSLCIESGQHILLKWCTIKKNEHIKNRHIYITSSTKISMRHINGVIHMEVKSGGKSVIFKTSNQTQAYEWGDQILEAFNSIKGSNKVI